MEGGERFTRLVAARLGVDLPTARRLLDIARAAARGRFGVRAAGFAVASWEPVARVLPPRLRYRALLGLLGPMLGGPAGVNAYAGGRLEPALNRDVRADPCER
jgi:hypothetical protein